MKTLLHKTIIGLIAFFLIPIGISSSLNAQIPYTTWDEVPAVLTSGEYDFSALPTMAGSTTQNSVIPKEITIDGGVVKISSKKADPFKYLQFNMKNDAKLTIHNLKIDNYREGGGQQNNRVSAIKVKNNGNNTLTFEGTENYLTGNGHGAAIGVNEGLKLTITGDGESMLKVVGGYSDRPNSTRNGSGIGGDFNLVNGDIVFSGSGLIDVTNLDSGAAIGTGYMYPSGGSFDDTQKAGSITFTDNVRIKAYMAAGQAAAIGSGSTYSQNSGISSPQITIEKNAQIHATTRGYNCAAIGNAYGTNLGQINIKDNVTVIALNNADYDPEKYSQNFGFGNFAFMAAGPGIGFQMQNTKEHNNNFDYINISGNPTIITGGNGGGIAAPNGNLNISGGNIKIFTRGDAGIGTSIPVFLQGDLSSEINISGKDTKIEILGRHVVTQEDLDNGLINSYKVGDIIDNYHPGIGLNVANNIDVMKSMAVNIKDATIDIYVGRGAGIGSAGTNMRKVETTKSFSKITIDHATVSSMSYYGAGIGGGFISNDKWDVKIINESIVEAISTSGGAGIGAGQGQKYYKGSTLINETTYAGAVIIDNSTVLAGSLHGAGIGGGSLNEYDVNQKPAGNQTPRNTDTEGTLLITNNADVKAYSRAYFSKKETDSYSYRDAVTAQLLPGSTQVMASHTFEPDMDRNEILTIQSFDAETDDLVMEMSLPKSMRSYAYSIPNRTGTVYYEKAKNEDGKSFKVAQYKNEELAINYREAGRHPSLNTFSSATEYKGLSTDLLNDNTFIGLDIVYTVTYNGNGQTAGTVPVDANSPYDENADVMVLDPGDLKKDNLTFDGWNTVVDGSGTAYVPGKTFAITQDITLYAQWKEKSVDPVTPPTVYYTVDLIAPYLSCYTYIPGDGMQEVEEGSCFTFEINYEYCCFPRCEFEVYSYPGMEPIAPKDSSNMKITYELCNIFENKVIEIKPICDCDDVSNEALDMKERIWTGAGKIFIENLSPDVVRIYNINGQTVYEDKLPQGQHAIPVAKGLYIVRLGDYREGVKVMVSDF